MRKYESTARVVSSVVERLVYTEDVGGSKPSPPTSFTSFTNTYIYAHFREEA